MSQKHLRQLLQEDQEPFFLNNYIADRKLHLQLQKPEKLPFSHNLRKNVCFFAFNNSPDPRNSPLFDHFKSPCTTRTPNQTAALLLEAALRIQKAYNYKQIKSNRFGLFGSLLKRLTNRRGNNKPSTRKREICDHHGVAKLFVKDVLEERGVKSGNSGVGCSCSYDGRTSCAVWSESNDEKSLNLDTLWGSSSSSSWYPSIDVVKSVINENFGNYVGNSYGDDQSGPFHFVLRQSPSSRPRIPGFSSPAISPSHFKTQEKESNESEEQCSPVSVLDPTFEDDDDRDQTEDHGFNMECSYFIVQEVKNQLLQKLLRFEKLAQLDPVELEKLMLEDEGDDYEDENHTNVDYLKTENCYNKEEEEEEEEEEESHLLQREENVENYVIDELGKSKLYPARKIPGDMRRLVTDLVNEEKREHKCYVEVEMMAKRVSRRLESWKEVEFNTIDMMVEQDMRTEIQEWERNQQQMEETALEIELGIFGLLVEELSQELY